MLGTENTELEKPSVIESAPKPIRILHRMEATDGDIAVAMMIVENPTNGRFHSVLLLYDSEFEEWAFMCGCEHFVYNKNVFCKHLKVVLEDIMFNGDEIWVKPVKLSLERNQTSSRENEHLAVQWQSTN